MRGQRAVVVAGVVALFLAGCATVEIREACTLAGQVTDESGRPVANTPVVVLARSLDLETKRLEYQERGRQEVRTTTDAQGHYRLEFVPAQLGNNFYLFFYDKTGFDQVKYHKPESLDITQFLRPDQPLRVNQVLRFTPAWPEIERQIAFYGADSERARILRRHGLPERRELSRSGNENTEIWWYYSDGVSYWFSGDKLTGAHTFTPIPGAAPAPFPKPAAGR